MIGLGLSVEVDGLCGSVSCGRGFCRFEVSCMQAIKFVPEAGNKEYRIQKLETSEATFNFHASHSVTFTNEDLVAKDFITFFLAASSLLLTTTSQKIKRKTDFAVNREFTSPACN
jgi:hypothetical protein